MEVPGDPGRATRNKLVQLNLKLQTVISVSATHHRHGNCVLVDIPVPAGITLRPGAAITLRLYVAGSPVSLRIPATGHIHSATCNHQIEIGSVGTVLRAIYVQDAAALATALSEGGSTEEVDPVRQAGMLNCTAVLYMRVVSVV